MEEILEFTIRLVEPSDARAMMGLVRRIKMETPYVIMTEAEALEGQQRIIEHFLADSHSLMLVVEVDGQLVGMGNVIGSYEPNQGHVAELGLCLVQEYWGYGIGSALMEELLYGAKELDFKVLQIEVIEQNNRARQLYLKYGFAECGILHKKVYQSLKYYNTVMMEYLI